MPGGSNAPPIYLAPQHYTYSITLNDVQSALYNFLYTPLCSSVALHVFDHASRNALKRTNRRSPCNIDLFPFTGSNIIDFLLDIEQLNNGNIVVRVHAR